MCCVKCMSSTASNWAIERALSEPKGSRSDPGEFQENHGAPPASDLTTCG